MRHFLSSLKPAIFIRVIVWVCAAVALLSCASQNSSQQVQSTAKQELHSDAVVDYAWLDSVNLSLYYCTRSFDDGSTNGFYMVGEVHAYNDPSSRFASILLDHIQPAIFMTEGAGPDAAYGELMEQYSKGIKSIFDPIGFDKPSVGKLALERGIRLVALEDLDSATGVYFGLTPSELKDFRAGTEFLAQSDSGTLKMASKMAQAVYSNSEKFFNAMMGLMEKAGVDTVKLVKAMEKYEAPRSGIVDTRNELMAAKAVEYIQPHSGCILIRFGAAHAEGMIEELGKNNCECEYRPLKEFLEAKR